MKKLTALLLALCLCLASCVMLASCDDDTPEHTHAYKTEWATDATHHWHACEGEGCTEVADKAEHTWNAGEITTPATHDAQGVKTYTCTACAATKTEAVQGDFTVTAEEWAYAMNLLNYENFTCVTTATMTVSGAGDMDGEHLVIETVTKSGTDFVFALELPAMQQSMTQYYYVKGDKYYEYQEEYQDNYEQVGVYHIDSLEHDQIFFFSDFAYNEVTGAYEAAEIVYSDPDIWGEGVTFTYTGCSIRFLDGKLIGIAYTADADVEGSGAGPMEMTVTYGTAPASIIPANLHRPS